MLQRRDGDKWVFAYTPAVGDGSCDNPIVIDPGNTYHYVERVRAYLSGRNVSPDFSASPAGTYRLMFIDIFDTWAPSDSVPGIGRRLPEAARVSNEFRVVEE